MELVPAPAITAGMVKTPVPMMLPMTSAVADGEPEAARRGAQRAGGGAVLGSPRGFTVVVMGPS